MRRGLGLPKGCALTEAPEASGAPGLPPTAWDLHPVGGMSKPIEKTIDETFGELEALTEEIRLKLHLASMDAKTKWNEELEPRIAKAREHARDAKTSSAKVVHDVVEALRAFNGAI